MNLVYEIEACVKKAALTLSPALLALLPNFRTINFQAGTLREITETLDGYGKSDTLRYEKLPIVCLVTPYLITSPRGADLKQWKGTLFIACATIATLRRAERSLKTFEPILNPIADEVLRQIYYSRAFQCYGELDTSHSCIEHDYWSKQKNANVFNEYVDAVEIRDLTINLSSPTCI